MTTADYVKALDGERIFIGEPVFALPGAEMPCFTEDQMSMTPRSGLVERLMAWCWPNAKAQADHAVYLRFIKVAQDRLWRAYSEDDLGTEEHLKSAIPWYAVATKRLVSLGFFASGARYLHGVAEVRAASAGLAVLLHRERTGSYPEQL